MRYFSILFFFSFLTFLQSNGQRKLYQQLLDTAIKSSNPFLEYKPIQKIRFDKDLIYESIRENLKSSIDTSVILDIINNNPFTDTAVWKDAEIKSLVLLTKDSITIEYIQKKLKLTDKKEIEYYKNLLNNLYNPLICKKGISRFSRPIFSKSKKYAIIQYDIRDCYNFGKSGLKLYVLKKRLWSEVGLISEWSVSSIHGPSFEE